MCKRIRHKLNKLMKSSPIYNKSQHYLIEHASIWIFLTLICVNGTRKENEERNEREREREREVGGDGVCGCSFGKPLRH